MMKKRRADMFGIRLKATSVVLLGTVLALVLAASAGIVQMLRVVAGAEQRAVHAIAQGVGTASELALAVHDTQELNRVAGAFLRNDQILFVALYDQSDKLIASSVRDKTAWDRFTANSSDHDNFMIERQSVSVESQNSDLDSIGGEIGENAVAPAGGRKPGAGSLKRVGSVVVGLSTAPGQQAVRQEVATIVISSVVAMLCAAITTSFFVGKWAVRLDRLMAASEGISKGDLEVAIQDDRLDEIGRLSQAYDRMRQAVRQRDIELRQFNETLQSQVKDRTRSLEDALHAAEAADKAKSLFLANMSHEIRTPLNGVVGMIDLLRRTSLNESQARFAAVARSSADALLSVINDILDFSKIEAGRLELESVTLDLTDLIENVAESVSVLAAKKGLEIGCTIDGNVPERVLGDPGRLGQIFNNLSNNAIKFTEKGHVVLAASLIGREADVARVRFTVSDSGIGIPADRKNRLFQSFSQVDASTTRKYGGTGLGLAICKRLVEMMGGEIGVDSEPGKGSTFWFVIPMAISADAVPSGNEAATIARLRHLNVLVVDDNPVNREIIERQLSAWELKVCVASDAPSAISILTERKLAGTPIEIAVLDWHMPGMDGIELARVIRASPQVGDTTLVILTSVDDSAMGPEIRALGFAGHLIKPVRQSRLLDVIADAAGARDRSAALATGAAATPAAGERSKQARPRSRAHILLVEDNEINRMVAGEILRNCGYTFEMAESGDVALVAVFARQFDLVLMDCQMPGMDGFEATRAIRQREKSEGETSPSPRHIPIVALTANAVKGDREMCLAAGMDDYVSKPVSAEKLVAAIEGQLHGKCDPQPAAPAQESSPSPAVPSGDPVDLPAFLERCMGNKKVATSVLAAFEAQVGKEMANLQRLIAEGSVSKVMKLAHLLKGSAGNVSAEGVRQAAAELERIGIIGDLSAAALQAEALKVEVDRCLEFLRRSQPKADAHEPGQMPIK